MNEHQHPNKREGAKVRSAFGREERRRKEEQ
jgi:hypothetical protein